MADLLKVYPGAQRALFAKYHIGGCQSCGFRPEETLDDVCSRNGGLPLVEVVAHIEECHTQELEKQVEPTELKGALAADEKPALLDLRTREEFENGNISGAELFTQDKLTEIMNGWDKQRFIVVYDHQGSSSCMDAAAYLEGHGFERVKTLRGGIDAYSQEVDPNLPRYRLEMA